MSSSGILPIKNYTRLISIVSKPIKVVVVVVVIVVVFVKKKITRRTATSERNKFLQDITSFCK